MATEREYIDSITGEAISENEIVKRALSQINKPKARFNWQRIYPRKLDKLSGILKSAQFNVVYFIWTNMVTSNNQFGGSYAEIAKATGVGLSTVTRVMTGLQKVDYIRLVRNGTWMINPQILFAGDENKLNMLLSIYGELPTFDYRQQKRSEDTPDQA